MSQLATSLAFMFVPVSGPPGVDLTQYPAPEVALIADTGLEPADADFHVGSWIAPDPSKPKEAALLIGPTAQVYPTGSYMAYVRITAGAERPVLKAGRWRIGD